MPRREVARYRRRRAATLPPQAHRADPRGAHAQPGGQAAGGRATRHRAAGAGRPPLGPGPPPGVGGGGRCRSSAVRPHVALLVHRADGHVALGARRAASTSWRSPGSPGAGAPAMASAAPKLAPSIGESDCATSYLSAVPQSRSSPGASKASLPPADASALGLARARRRRARSRPSSRCRGGSAARTRARRRRRRCRRRSTVPRRVIADHDLAASRRSRAARSEPTSGVATIQSPVSLGQPRTGGRAGGAERLQVHAGGAAPAPPRRAAPSTSRDRRAGEELEVVHLRRPAGQELAGLRVPGGHAVGAALVLVDRQVERADHARPPAPRTPSGPRRRRTPGARRRGSGVASRPVRAGHVGLRARCACRPARPWQELPSRVEDVAEAGGGDHAHLAALAAGRAGERRRSRASRSRPRPPPAAARTSAGRPSPASPPRTARRRGPRRRRGSRRRGRWRWRGRSADPGPPTRSGRSPAGARRSRRRCPAPALKRALVADVDPVLLVGADHDLRRGVLVAGDVRRPRACRRSRPG